MLTSLLMWSLAQWAEYHTGMMYYGNPVYGVLEANYTLAVFSVITLMVGADTWHMQLPLD